MAPTTRRRSARHAFADEDDGANQHHHIDAPVEKKAKKETAAAAVNGVGKAGANGTAGVGAKAAGGRRTRAGECEFSPRFASGCCLGGEWGALDGQLDGKEDDGLIADFCSGARSGIR